jgi:HSP20 family protein
MPKPIFQTTHLYKKIFSDKNTNIAQEDTGDEKESGQLSLDVYETPTELVIVAPVAGVRMQDINVSVTEDILTISGERHLEFTIPDDDYLIQECFWGNFSRSIVLPSTVDPSKVNAAYKNGILKITLPRTEKTKTKLIKIKSE